MQAHHISTLITVYWCKTKLAHRSRMTHICVNKIIIIGSGNGLSSGQRQAIIWISAGILLIWHLGINLIEINTFSFMKMHMKMSSEKWRIFHLGLNELFKSKGSSIPYTVYTLYCRMIPDSYYETATWNITPVGNIVPYVIVDAWRHSLNMNH